MTFASALPGGLLALIGPTGSGKTQASLSLAKALSAEIVYADSAAMYKGMDVATTKPTPEEMAHVPHHMIDVAEPPATLSVREYQALALQALSDISSRGRRALIVAGSGLYYRALVDRFAFPGTDAATRRWLQTEAAFVGSRALHARLATIDPESARRIDPGNSRRVVRALEIAALTGRTLTDQYGDWNLYPADRVTVAGIAIATSVLHQRIEGRVRKMFGGILEETRSLLERGHRSFLLSCPAIGYREAVACVEGRMSDEDAAASIIRRHKMLARRQMAWFRRDPRIRWFEAGSDGAAGIVDQLAEYLRGGVWEAMGV
jgi:tRNA dimethylallyltransferase